jgi:hypothetical protein
LLRRVLGRVRLLRSGLGGLLPRRVLGRVRLFRSGLGGLLPDGSLSWRLLIFLGRLSRRLLGQRLVVGINGAELVI